MTQWEYLQKITTKGRTLTFLEMSSLGGEGWELVTFTYLLPDKKAIYIFKRPKE